ncbi:MAG: response regulator [Pyrinomonadaceae bacterium]
MHLTILHVEDNQLVAATVKELLAYEGWRVTLCPDGPAGLRALESRTHYDLLLMDNELPGLDGWRLIQHARTLPHRQATPIIMMSARDMTQTATEVGADAFLMKPEGVARLVPTISRLVNRAAR